MCSPTDLHATVLMRDLATGNPTLYLYDSYPGGIGLAERVFREPLEVYNTALDMVTGCPCEEGCPSCIGAQAGGPLAKPLALQLLQSVVGV